jgi:uncharacterized protein
VDPLIFEWDEAKARTNVLKHGVGFAAAVKVFSDPDRVERLDRRQDYGEERFQLIGRVNRTVMFVVYVRRGDVVRIISARKALKSERQAYHALRS